MERYRFILTNNETGQKHTCQYLPDNIQGVKITKRLKLDIPFGYIISASQDTVKLVSVDKDFVRDIFLARGLNADVSCELQSLNRMATEYYTVFIGNILFAENFYLYDTYCEFGIVLNSAEGDFRERMKIEQTLAPPSNAIMNIPQMSLYNIVSGTCNIGGGVVNGSDSSIHFVAAYLKETNVQLFNTNITAFGEEDKELLRLTPFSYREFTYLFKIRHRVTNGFSGDKTVDLIFDYKNNVGGTCQTHMIKIPFCVAYLDDGSVIYERSSDIDYKKDVFNNTYNEVLRVQRTFSFGNPTKSSFVGRDGKTYSLSGGSGYTAEQYTMYKVDFMNPFSTPNGLADGTYSITAVIDMLDTTPLFRTKFLSLEECLEQMTSGYNITYRQRDIDAGMRYGIVSGDMIAGTENAVAVIKPRDLLIDFCTIMGYSFYFDRDGILQLKPLESIIDTSAPQQEFKEIKDFEMIYCPDMVYSGVDVGYEQPSIDFQLYRQQFCEKLNYAAAQKRGDRQFNLVVSKLRADYAGIAITYYQNFQAQKKGDVTKKFKDIWLIAYNTDTSRPYTTNVTTNLQGVGVFNVPLSPARILQNNKFLLSALFTCFGNNYLLLGGQENIENQMTSQVNIGSYSDNITEKAAAVNVAGANLFTPWQIKFTTLGEITDINVFDIIIVRGEKAVVINVETTLRLQELEITALKVKTSQWINPPIGTLPGGGLFV
jgi:hypothetical protein